MTNFSYSAISTSMRCNKLYQYIYLDKLKSEVPKSADMIFGTAIHLGIEGILSGDDGVKDFDIFWNIEKTKGNRYGRNNWSELLDQGHILLERFKRLHAKHFTVYQMEQRLYGQLASIGVEGTPDFIGDYKGVRSIVDFKTSGGRYPKEKAMVSEQLALYDHLARQSLGYEAEQVVYVVLIKGKTPSIQVLVERINRDLYDRLLTNIETIAKELLAKEVTKQFTQNRQSCLMGEIKCDYWTTCLNTSNVNKGGSNE